MRAIWFVGRAELRQRWGTVKAMGVGRQFVATVIPVVVLAVVAVGTLVIVNGCLRRDLGDDEDGEGVRWS